MCYTPSRFVCVPGTHTAAFHADFVAKYAAHYPHVKPKDKKMGLSKDKPDPLDLVQAKRCVPIPQGCLLIWHPRLLHGQVCVSVCLSVCVCVSVCVSVCACGLELSTSRGVTLAVDVTHRQVRSLP